MKDLILEGVTVADLTIENICNPANGVRIREYLNDDIAIKADTILSEAVDLLETYPNLIDNFLGIMPELTRFRMSQKI